MPGAARPCDWTRATAWTFEPLDDAAFPAVELARQSGRFAGTAPAVYNAANEEAVEAFHAGALSFLGIVDVVAAVLAEHVGDSGDDVRSNWSSDDELTLERVLAADAWARQRAVQVVSAMAERESAR